MFSRIRSLLHGHDRVLLLIALAQALLLMGLMLLLENDLWPSESAPWRFTLFTVVLGGPLLLLLGLAVEGGGSGAARSAEGQGAGGHSEPARNAEGSSAGDHSEAARNAEGSSADDRSEPVQSAGGGGEAARGGVVFGMAGQDGVWGAVGLFTLVAGLLGYYAGSQVAPDQLAFPMVGVPYIMLTAVAAFKFLMYVQHLGGDEPFGYSALFRRSWRNFLTVGLAYIFGFIFFGILVLWSELFKAIGIDFFFKLFLEREWVLMPTLVLAFCVGLMVLRRQSRIIDTIVNIQQVLAKFLLPLLALISVMFLLALPFTGLATLWDSGGSLLILWMQAFILFFINAVYGDDSESPMRAPSSADATEAGSVSESSSAPASSPYPLWLHRFVYGGVALLPVYSVISCYGLSLRVMQYGWSLHRCYAFLIWALLALFALGYCYSIIRRRDGWLPAKNWINVRMGVVVLASVLMVNSPLLDFREISAASQMARLNSGEVTPEDFDIPYLYHHLARPGYEALQEVKERSRGTDPETAERIEDYISHHAGLYRRRVSREDMAAEDLKQRRVDEIMQAMVVSESTHPASLVTAVSDDVSRYSHWLLDIMEFHIHPVNLNGDGDTEYLVIGVRAKPERDEDATIELFLYYRDYRQPDVWRRDGVRRIRYGSLPDDDTLDRLVQGEFTVSPLRWNQIEVGDFTIRP